MLSNPLLRLRESPLSKTVVLYPLFGLLGLYFGPDLLTGYNGPDARAPFDLIDYLRSLQIIASLVLLWFTGLALSLIARRRLNIPVQENPFVILITGFIALFLYTYIRSLLNTFLGLPLTEAELCIIAISAVIFCLKQPGNLGEYLKPYTFFSIYIFFLICVALAHFELPRTIMLSSDPDQHAFFATQILKLGGVPFSQGDWGNLSFGYPSGTGVLIFIFSSLSLLDISDTTMIMPAVLSYISIFLLCETAFKGYSDAARSYSLVFCVLVFFYLLLYGLELAHFHLEGYGRMASLWVAAVIIHFVSDQRNSKNLSGESNYWLVLIFGSLFVVIALNPVNLFLPFIVFALVFLAKYPHQFWKLFCLALLLPMLILDPYYFELVFGITRTGGFELLVEPGAPDSVTHVDFSQLLHLVTQYFRQPSAFFSLEYLPDSFQSTLCGLLALCLVSDTSESDFGKKFIGLLLVLFLIWVVLSAIFLSVQQVTTLRLLAPYFQYSKLQFVYCITFILFAIFAVRLFSLSPSHLYSALAVILFWFGLSTLQEGNETVVKKPRVDYCGSMGCFTGDDKTIVHAMEEIYRNHIPIDGKPSPRILVPNAISIHGIEKWLMPRGGTRSVPFHDTFPLAFFYFQGEPNYTVQNYIEHVCNQFDVDWLMQNNIQYLFIPTDVLDACLFGNSNFDNQFEVVAESGASRLFKLYD